MFLNKWADKMDENMDELITLECEDNGKPYEFAQFDMYMCTMMARYYAGLAMEITGSAHCRDTFGPYNNQIVYERREPVGISGLISPWNFPALLGVMKMAPMLAAGCTGVLKNPELTPLSTLRMVELWHEIDGMIPGVINSVPGLGADAGEALTGHPLVRKLSFTGSTATGKRVMARASESMKRCTLELGGKSPLVVFADADMDKAVSTAAAMGFLNSGQFCGAPTRLIVEESCYDEFCAKMVA